MTATFLRDNVLFLSLTAVFVALSFWIYSKRAKGLPGVPHSDPHYPFFGNLFVVRSIFGTKEWLSYNVDQALKFKRSFTLDLPNKPVVIRLVDEASVKYILEDNFSNYIKIDSPVTKSFTEEFFGDGIFAIDGDPWKFHRKAASYMFSTNVLRYMVDVFIEHGNTFVDILEEAAKSKRTIDMQENLQRYTMDSICRIAFGVHFDSLHLPQGEKPAFSHAFDHIQILLTRRFTVPVVIFKLFKQFTLGKAEKEIIECAQILDSTVMQVLETREKEIGNSPKNDGKWQDLLSQFVKMANERNEPLNKKHVRDVVMNFLIAGRDTTACLLTWALYEIAKRPEMEKKIIDEIKSVHGDDNPSYDSVKELDFTERFLLEVLRLHPPVPFDSKRAAKDDFLPDGTFIPASTIVGYSPYMMGRLPWLWEEPDELKPERWVDGKHSDFKFVTFNAGPRICLGKRMALVEAKVVLCMLLTKFRFEIVPEQTEDVHVGFILWLKDGLLMRVHKLDAE